VGRAAFGGILTGRRQNKKTIDAVVS